MINKVNIVRDGISFTLLKINDNGRRIVLTNPVSKYIGLPNLHDTFHMRNEKEGFPDDIIHLRETLDSKTGDITLQRQVIEESDFRMIGNSFLDISELDWASGVAKSKDNDRSVNLPWDKFNNHLTVYIYLDKTGKGEAKILEGLKKGKISVWTLYKDGVREVPPTKDQLDYVLGDFERPIYGERIVLLIVNTKSHSEIAWDGIPTEEQKGGFAAFAPGKRKIQPPHS